VQDGCDYNCSFCTIPLARGKSRSHPIANVLADIRTIAASGVKEIVLTGVNLGDFGKDASGMRTSENFCQLLEAIERTGGVERYRISSIEPNLLTDRIIDLVAGSSRIMPHFHIPLQSGSNRILASMRRRYRRELYAEKVERIRKLVPHCGIGADVITGFPGETEEDFLETVEFLTNLDVSYLHVFTYSEREHTPALGIGPSIPPAVRQERTRILRSLSCKMSAGFLQRHAGQTRKVLFEGRNRDGMIEGYTDNYIKVAVPYTEAWSNRIIDWTL